MGSLNWEICHLKYDSKQKLFAPPDSDIRNHRAEQESDTSALCAMNCGASLILPFIGDPIHSKIEISIRAPSQNRSVKTCCVLDSGSEVNVIVDQFFVQHKLP